MVLIDTNGYRDNRMVTRIYTLKRFDRDIHRWILSLPEFAGIEGYHKFTLNHVDTNTESEFQTELAIRTGGFDVDGVKTNIGKFIDEVKTDQLFFTTETAVTKTNIGTTYIDVFSDYGGRPFFIDTTGFTKMAIQILWTKIGTGTQTMRIINDVDDTQIIVESGSLITGSNDFTNVNIPVSNFKGKWRLQCKSTVAQDDPTFSGMRIYLRR